jgi:hypothetical protein
MKLLRRNTTEFEYIPYTGMTEIMTDDDEHTGEYAPGYGDPVKYRGNISTPSGMVNQTFYGEEIRYTHTLVMDKPDADIHEGGVIRWKGELYDIRSVRPSQNVLSVALRKQTTDNAEGDG